MVKHGLVAALVCAAGLGLAQPSDGRAQSSSADPAVACADNIDAIEKWGGVKSSIRRQSEQALRLYMAAIGHQSAREFEACVEKSQQALAELGKSGKS